ncbi:uncharacterized protein LOC113330850 [Papaver somniferum]|uniref:uncharacterized protein LOC113330850 n=1 Tax=Papaver somniferum TaxID=3469 RepID=UPI000E6F499B|nr:uncharacterized protein LOC113330850 [Papaver somniferum]
MGDDTDPPQSRVLTYAEKVLGKKQLLTTTLDLNTLPNPTLKEGKPTVVLSVSYYEEGCDIWKFSLIGRLDFKGINFQDVKNSFEQQWQLGQGRVQFIPMNRGFYIIKLQSMEDRDRILNVEAWMFEQQKLNLMEWFLGFGAEKHNTSHATVWVKFPGLPVEYWIEKTLLAFGKSLGTAFLVDKRTLDHEYGYYASVLIDINFAELDTDGIHILQASASIQLDNNSITQEERGNNVASAGNDWQEPRRRKGKTAPVIPIVPELPNGNQVTLGNGQQANVNNVPNGNRISGVHPQKE